MSAAVLPRPPVPSQRGSRPTRPQTPRTPSTCHLGFRCCSLCCCCFCCGALPPAANCTELSCTALLRAAALASWLCGVELNFRHVLVRHCCFHVLVQYVCNAVFCNAVCVHSSCLLLWRICPRPRLFTTPSAALASVLSTMSNDMPTSCCWAFDAHRFHCSSVHGTQFCFAR